MLHALEALPIHPNVTVPTHDMSLAGRSHLGSGTLGPSVAIRGLQVQTIDASPARIALLQLAYQSDVDRAILLAGCNVGLNLGSDLSISGTFGAATEAAHFGATGVAVSAPKSWFSENSVSVCFPCFSLKLLQCLDLALATETPLWNINFPIELTPESSIVKTGVSSSSAFPVDIQRTRREHQICAPQLTPKATGLRANDDIRAVLVENNVSLSPLTPGHALVADWEPGISVAD